MTTTLIILITLYAIAIVRSRTVSNDAILGSTVALYAFSALVWTIGLSAVSIGVLCLSTAVVWTFEILSRPRVAMWQCGRLSVGVAVTA